MDFKEKIFIKTVPMARPTNAMKGLPVGQWKIAKKLNLQKGRCYKGRSYVDMMNSALLTDIKEGYIKSSYPLDYVGVGDGIAWFAFFDGNFRKSGKDGVYCNEFISENEILETCNIDDASEYVKKRSGCKPVRFVFSKSAYDECRFEGIFYQVSIDMYMCDGKLIGETILKRYEEYEKYL
jgi:hypothetical protein